MKPLNCLTLVMAIVLVGCQSDGTADYEFHCGTQLRKAELAKYAKKKKPAYTFEELKLLAKISNLVFNENEKKKNYDVQFWNRAETSFVIQVFGISDYAAMDRSACAVFGFKEFNFPKETILVFYGTEKDTAFLKPMVGLRMGGGK